MRSLGTVAEDARKLHSYGGVLACLKIEFASGTRYLSSSWEPADVSSSILHKIVTSWGDVRSSLGESNRFPQTLSGITVTDPNGTIREIWEDESFQRLPCTLYWAIWTPGQAVPTLAQSTTILRGAVSPPEAWSEYDLSIELGLTDFSLRRQNAIELRATKGDWAYISLDDDGRVIPLVYGQPRGYPAIYANGGPIARLTGYIDEDDTVFYVDEAREFPQSTPITVSIGHEHIVGSFAGNKFTATERGKILVTSTTTHDAGGRALAKDTSLIGDGDNRYVGYMLRPTVQITDGAATRQESFDLIITGSLPRETILDRQARTIIRFDSTNGILEFDTPFLIETEIGYVSGTGIVADSQIQETGEECSLKANVPYQIRTIATEHADGSTVRLVTEPAQFVVSRGHVNVKHVFVHGIYQPPDVRFLARRGVNPQGSIAEIMADVVHEYLQPDAEPGWIPIADELFTVSHTTHPTTGDNITVVSLPRRPTELPGYIADRDGVLVDLDNTASANPANVIQDICNTYGGMAVNFATAATKLANWHFDFFYDQISPVTELIADLAYQCRCALRWTGEDPVLIYQGANGGNADESIGRSEILTDLDYNSSFAMSRDDLESVYSQVTVNWREQSNLVGIEKEQSYTERDATVESIVGRRNLNVDCWAYQDSGGPRALAKYLLERHKHQFRIIDTDVSAYGIAIEPGDLINVTHPVLPTSPELGQVVNAIHRVGVSPQVSDLIHLTLRQYHWPGCSSTGCMGNCETTGCETACQTGWQPTACWLCQTACQTRCEFVACVTAAQTVCGDTSCQSSCTTGCMVFCMPTTMTTGCGHCETTSCETTDCQSTSCQQADCQTTGCQTTDCQTTDCQTTGCQTTDCQATNCQTTGCQTTDCQTTDCQTTGCQTAVQA